MPISFLPFTISVVYIRNRRIPLLTIWLLCTRDYHQQQQKIQADKVKVRNSVIMPTWSKRNARAFFIRVEILVFN
jgi:hypothetical protein